MMRSTPYAHVNSLLDDLLSRMREVLRDKLVGLYLYGSLRTGDFDPEISDIDLLAAGDFLGALDRYQHALRRSQGVL